MSVKAIVKKNLCKDIRKDDEVEILPEYNYMIGENIRIKDYFNVKSGEVVIRKRINIKNKLEEHAIIKCSRKDIYIKKI